MASVNAGVVELTQTVDAPSAIAEITGKSLTVNEVVAEFEQPLPLVAVVYLTVTVPAVNPVTTPPEVILAVPVPSIIDHVPDGVASVKAGVVAPVQTDEAPPAIAATTGSAFIVKALLAKFTHPFKSG